MKAFAIAVLIMLGSGIGLKLAETTGTDIKRTLTKEVSNLDYSHKKEGEKVEEIKLKKNYNGEYIVKNGELFIRMPLDKIKEKELINVKDDSRIKIGKSYFFDKRKEEDIWHSKEKDVISTFKGDIDSLYVETLVDFKVCKDGSLVFDEEKKVIDEGKFSNLNTKYIDSSFKDIEDVQEELYKCLEDNVSLSIADVEIQKIDGNDDYVFVKGTSRLESEIIILVDKKEKKIYKSKKIVAGLGDFINTIKEVVFIDNTFYGYKENGEFLKITKNGDGLKLDLVETAKVPSDVSDMFLKDNKLYVASNELRSGEFSLYNPKENTIQAIFSKNSTNEFKVKTKYFDDKYILIEETKKEITGKIQTKLIVGEVALDKINVMFEKNIEDNMLETQVIAVDGQSVYLMGKNTEDEGEFKIEKYLIK